MKGLVMNIGPGVSTMAGKYSGTSACKGLRLWRVLGPTVIM
jgi:hypothetical protein